MRNLIRTVPDAGNTHISCQTINVKSCKLLSVVFVCGLCLFVLFAFWLLGSLCDCSDVQGAQMKNSIRCLCFLFYFEVSSRLPLVPPLRWFTCVSSSLPLIVLSCAPLPCCLNGLMLVCCCLQSLVLLQSCVVLFMAITVKVFWFLPCFAFCARCLVYVPKCSSTSMAPASNPHLLTLTLLKTTGFLQNWPHFF